MSASNLGIKARDRITGFKGVITSHIEYLTGCEQYGITPEVGPDGRTGDVCYFDTSRVEVLNERVMFRVVPEPKHPDSLQPARRVGGPGMARRETGRR